MYAMPARSKNWRSSLSICQVQVYLCQLLRCSAAAAARGSASPFAIDLYPAAPMTAAGQAYWNASLNSWGGSVYNDSVRRMAVQHQLPALRSAHHWPAKAARRSLAFASTSCRRRAN
jgi:hypothetical protein